MKHLKTVQVPASTRDVVDHVSCDLCGREIIEREFYKVDEVEIRHKTGASYPDGGSGEETSVDMCGKCFDEKLVPWLRAQGVAPRTEPWEW
jgi:hypothetical protein